MAARTLPKNVTMSSTSAGTVTKPDKTKTTGTFTVHADRAVWDSANNKYLYPGVDYDPYVLFGE